MWAGEGDLPTPDFIYEAAIRSLRDGETFYTAQRGIPELRAALARYHERTYGRSFADERFFVTGGGMQAIQIAARMVAGHGDEVLVPTPAWPNITAAIAINGATPVEVPLSFGNAGWTLDLDRLFAAATERTKGIFINSPSNPTGWTATRDELRAILDFARARGLFIIADEVYHRFYYAGARSPSFHDVAEPEDRILYVNTFSKNWAMTGWRIGWLSTSPALGQTIENLVQYSTSGVATFMQRAATVALDEGDAVPRAAGRPGADGEGHRLRRPRRERAGALRRAGRRLLSVLRRRRRGRHAGAGAPPGRRGQYRARAGHCLRRGRQRLHAALLREQRRADRGGDRPAGRLAETRLTSPRYPSTRSILTDLISTPVPEPGMPGSMMMKSPIGLVRSAGTRQTRPSSVKSEERFAVCQWLIATPLW